MKYRHSIRREAFLALALITGSATAVLADDATATPATSTTTTTAAATTDTTTAPEGGWHHHHHGFGVLTAAEREQLKKDRHAALAANGTLKAQGQSIREQFKTLKTAGTAATEAQWQALHQQVKAFRTQLRQAEVALDPSVAPVFAKLDAARAAHHHGSATN